MKIKKHLLYGALICLSQTISAQIGINTEDPKQFLHIASPLNSLNDAVVVTSEGIVGIGNWNPRTTSKLQIAGERFHKGNVTVKQNSLITGSITTSKLGIGSSLNSDTENYLIDIKTPNNSIGLTIGDVSAVSGHMLTSDKNGYVYWDALRPMSSVVLGKLGENMDFSKEKPALNEESWFATEIEPLVLSPGTWLIMAKQASYGKTNSFSIYMRLRANKTVNTYTSGSTVASPIEKNRQIARTAMNGEDRLDGISSPEMYVIVVVPTNTHEPGEIDYYTEFYLDLAINMNSGKMRVEKRGNDTYFKALRIDRPSK